MNCISPRRIRSGGTNGIQFCSTIALTPGAYKARDNEIIIRRTSTESNPIYLYPFHSWTQISLNANADLDALLYKFNSSEFWDVISTTTLIYSSSRLRSSPTNYFATSKNLFARRIRFKGRSYAASLLNFKLSDGFVTWWLVRKTAKCFLLENILLFLLPICAFKNDSLIVLVISHETPCATLKNYTK